MFKHNVYNNNNNKLNSESNKMNKQDGISQAKNEGQVKKMHIPSNNMSQAPLSKRLERLAEIRRKIDNKTYEFNTTAETTTSATATPSATAATTATTSAAAAAETMATTTKDSTLVHQKLSKNLAAFKATSASPLSSSLSSSSTTATISATLSKKSQLTEKKLCEYKQQLHEKKTKKSKPTIIIDSNKNVENLMHENNSQNSHKTTITTNDDEQVNAHKSPIIIQTKEPLLPKVNRKISLSPNKLPSIISDCNTQIDAAPYSDAEHIHANDEQVNAHKSPIITQTKEPLLLKVNRKTSLSPNEKFSATNNCDYMQYMESQMKQQSAISLPENNEILYESVIKPVPYDILVHSNEKVQPLYNIADAFFMSQIHENLHYLGIKNVNRTQAYAWPHLLNGNSLFVVNAPRTGKTWSYLPAICSKVVHHYCVENLNDERLNVFGPLAIILVSSVDKIEQLLKLCEQLLYNIKLNVKNVVPLYGVRDFDVAKVHLMSCCGILITTPTNLLRLLNDEYARICLDGTRLRHLVIDDIDIMLKNYGKLFNELMMRLDKILKKTSNKMNAQLIVTSNYWMNLLKKLMNYTNKQLLLIGDFVEAAVYGKIKIKLNLLTQTNKIETILEYLRKITKEQMQRVAIVCNEDNEMFHICDGLTKNSIECLGYHSEADISLRNKCLRWGKKLSDVVLIVLDSTYSELELHCVDHLIHYSLPNTWTKFTKRFTLLTDNMPNIFAQQTNDNNVVVNDENTWCSTSLILLDENNNKHLPRLINFLLEHKQFVPSDIVALSKRIKLCREEERSNLGVPLCLKLLECGECHMFCDYRHTLTQLDAIDENSQIPNAGYLNVQILKIFSPTHYSARLLECKPFGTNVWKKLTFDKGRITFSMRLQTFCAQASNLTTLWPLKMYDICFYQYKGNYERARLIKIPFVRNEEIVKNVLVDIKLIDLGDVLFNVSSKNLFACPDEFKNFPVQAYDLYMIGLSLIDNEIYWDSGPIQCINNWLINDIGKDQKIHVDICFSTTMGIWINNLVVFDSLKTIGTHAYHVNLKRKLVHNNFCVLSEREKNCIYQQAKELGFVKSNLKEITKINDKQPNIIDNDVEEHEITKTPIVEISKKVTDKIDKVEEENWDINDENDELKNNEISVPICDTYEQHINARRFPTTNENSIPKQNAKQANNKFYKEIEKLDIEMKTSTDLIKLEKWCELKLHDIEKVEIGNEKLNGKWELIFLQSLNPNIKEKYDYLVNKLIASHIEKLKATQKGQISDVECLQIGQPYIMKIDNSYQRVKLMSSLTSEHHYYVTAYQFFICDLAILMTVDKSVITDDDFLYETTAEIINYMPYQSVHCTLTGIELKKPMNSTYKLTKNYLYVYAVTERAQLSNDFGIKSYEVLLYECDKDEENIKFDKMLNKMLIENNCATYNENTKQYLELEMSRMNKDLAADFVESLLNNQMNSNGTNENFNDKYEQMDEFFDFLQKSMNLNDKTANGDEGMMLLQQTFEKTKEVYMTALENEEQKQKKEQLQQQQPQQKERTRNEEKESAWYKEKAQLSNEEMERQSSTSSSPSSSKSIDVEYLTPVENDIDVYDETLSRASSFKTISDNDEIEIPTLPTTSTNTENNNNNNNIKPFKIENLTKNDLTNSHLVCVNPRPQVKWYMKNFVIYFVINAPDILDYFLLVKDNTFLYHDTDINGKNRSFRLDLFSYVNAQMVTHEQRGINVIVRLVQEMFLKWPRLLESEDQDHHNWLRHNFDTNDLEAEPIEPAICFNENDDDNVREVCFDDLSNDDDDDNDNYVGINNNNNLYNPDPELSDEFLNI